MNELSARSPYLVADDVAERLHCSLRTVYELSRLGQIPHRKLAGSRRLLFLEAELVKWENGATLERTDLPRGGRIVRPAESTSAANHVGPRSRLRRAS